MKESHCLIVTIVARRVRADGAYGHNLTYTVTRNPNKCTCKVTKELIERNTFRYGLPDVRAIPFDSGPGNEPILGHFWHTAAQAEPLILARRSRLAEVGQAGQAGEAVFVVFVEKTVPPTPRRLNM